MRQNCLPADRALQLIDAGVEAHDPVVLATAGQSWVLRPEYAGLDLPQTLRITERRDEALLWVSEDTSVAEQVVNLSALRWKPAVLDLAEHPRPHDGGGARLMGIRCPVLRVDPKMLDRLAEIETDLTARRARAETEIWLGELEGIDLTLDFLHSKREEALRLGRIPAVGLGMATARREEA